MAKKDNDHELADILLDDFDKFEHFFVGNWRQIIVACVVVVIVVTIGAIILSVKQGNEYKAASAIANAETVEELNKVIGEYASYPEINSARLKLAMQYLEKKEYDKATDQFRELSILPITNELQWRARLNIAYIKELQDRKDEAIQDFVQIGSDGSLPEAVRVQANYSAGRINVELGNNDAAKPLLKLADIPSEYGKANHLWSEQARDLLSRLNTPPSIPEDKKEEKTAVKAGKKTVQKKKSPKNPKKVKSAGKKGKRAGRKNRNADRKNRKPGKKRKMVKKVEKAPEKPQKTVE